MKIPYTLRARKYVDRAIFIDLLHRLSSWRPIHDYIYVGFGGPFLDDFRLLHHAFGFKRMISIENNDSVYSRQQANLPCAAVDCLNWEMSYFLANHNFDEPTILWVDFESPKHYLDQFELVFEALTRLEDGDIFRITFNTDPNSLQKEDFTELEEEERIEKRRDILKSRLGKYAQGITFPDEALSGSCDLAPIFAEILQLQAVKAREGSRAKYLHLMSLTYQDTTRMLTITGAIAQRKEELTAVTTLNTWSLATFDDYSPHHIDVPTLSAPERIAIEKFLPAKSVEELRQSAGSLVPLSDDEWSGLHRYYRYLPHFQRTSVFM